jgi:hypothetical protein
VRLLEKLLLIAAGGTAFLVALALLDYAASAVAGIADYLYAYGERLGGGWRFPRLGPQLDTYISTLIGPLAAAIVAVAAFELLAHERER